MYIDESYIPFDHRDVKKPTSDCGALAHMLKTSLGSGILAMPMAFKNAGLVLGSAGTVIIGLIAAYCIDMLITCSQVLCSRNRVPIMTYSETTKKAFENGPPSAKRSATCMGIVVTAQVLCSFMLGNSVYVVFMSHSLNQVVMFFAKKSISTRYYTLMLWVPLICMCMVRDLATLVPFSIIANILVVVSFGIVMYYIFRNMHGTGHVYLVAPFPRWPAFITTVIFSLEGIGTVLSIENEMKNPQHFVSGRCPISYTAMSIVIVVYAFVGFFGYLEYDEATTGSITLNLPNDEPLAQSVKIFIAVAIFFTYALQFYVPINLVRDMIMQRTNEKYYLLCDILVRIALVSSTIFIALLIPNLEPIITLVGAICFSALGLLIPSLIDIMTRYPEFGRFRWHLVKDSVIAILGVTAMVSGTYISVIDIYTHYI